VYHVTEIIKHWAPDYSDVPMHTLVERGEAGTMLHEYCRDYMLGLWVPMLPKLVGFTDSFKRYVDLIDIVLLCERRLESSVWHYTGQIDILHTFKNDPTIILTDYKSPLAYHKSWALQTSGYKLLVEENALLIKYGKPINAITGSATIGELFNWKDLQVGRWGSLRLRKDGGVAIFNPATEVDVRAFIAACIIYEWDHKEVIV